MSNQLCFYSIIVFFSIPQECEPNHNLLFKEGLGWKPHLGFGRFENHHWSHIWKFAIFKKHATPITIPRYQYQVYFTFRVYNPLSSLLTFEHNFCEFCFSTLLVYIFPYFPTWPFILLFFFPSFLFSPSISLVFAWIPFCCWLCHFGQRLEGCHSRVFVDVYHDILGRDFYVSYLSF
jgi:hypothetical protein